MADRIEDIDAEIAAIDQAKASISATGASSVSGFGRSVSHFTLAQLEAQRAKLVTRRNALIDPNSIFGTVTIR